MTRPQEIGEENLVTVAFYSYMVPFNTFGWN